MILKRFQHTVQNESALDALLCNVKRVSACCITTRYAIIGNTDDVEGRGLSIVRALVEGSSEAHKAAAHAGPMGSRGGVDSIKTFYIEIEVNGKQHTIAVPIKDIFVSDTLEDENERLKKNALAKLTDDEKRVLGLLK